MDFVAAAVANNADWCDLVCRAHGLATTRTDHYLVGPREPTTLLSECRARCAATWRRRRSTTWWRALAAEP